jgi:hypothetical protein
MKWSDYNQSLVKRVEILLGFDVINNWDEELKEMNKDKIGGHFTFQINFLLLGFAKVYFHLPYRQTEGIAQGHAKGKVSCIPYYSTISRRINRLNIKISDSKIVEFKDGYIVITINSVGIKITNRDKWLKDKWNIRKDTFKIHIAVDVKSKNILSIKITDERVHISKTLPKLIDGIIKSDRCIR